MSIELTKINRYPELKTIVGYDELYDYLETLANHGNHVYPPQINSLRKQFRWREKFQHFVTGPPARDIYYRPSADLNLRVCRVNLREQACDDIVNNLHYTPTGINSFYKVVCSRYIGIPKLFVANYLKKQVDYQVGRSYHKVQNTHIIAQTQNER